VWIWGGGGFGEFFMSWGRWYSVGGGVVIFMGWLFVGVVGGVWLVDLWGRLLVGWSGRVGVVCGVGGL